MNKPIKNGIAKKTPVVMQLEALECGAACLTMILSYYEKWIPLEQVRIDCGVSRDGSSAKKIIAAANNYGLIAKAYRFEPDDFKEDASFPCIVHWNFNHFVVLKGFKGNYAYINDPARGDLKVSMKAFDEAFTGVCIMFEPGENFVPSGKRKNTFNYVKEKAQGLGPIIAFIVLVTCISSLISLILPGFLRIFYDRLLSGSDLQWAKGFLCFYAGFAALQVLAEWLNATSSYKINGKIAVIGASTFMWKVLRLPLNFFSQRMVGDVMSRQNSNATIANTVANTLAPLIIETGMMVFYLIIMLKYNIWLTIIAIVATLTDFLVSVMMSRKRINATRIMLRDTGKLGAIKMAGIESIESIKSAGAEDGFFARWAGYQASSNEGKAQYDKISTNYALIPQIVSSICDITILSIGLYLTIQGEFTLGMIIAFQGYLAGFFAPANRLIAAGETLNEMKTEIERIDDVMQYPLDFVFEEEKNERKADNELSHEKESLTEMAESKYEKLSGNIEIKNVTFGYSPLSEPLIKDFNLSIKKGSKIALVGSSGCGKSTLSKLICGVEKPWSGEILFDGKHIDEIDRNVFTGSVAVVDQDVTIFEDTINNNITMWDNTIENFETILAARDAQIHSDIMQREDGYNYKLTEGGRDFSGGQKQRLEIARVLAQDPTICILDEATSALDAKTEYDVIKAIKCRGITCIVIAHRLSTIRDCDEIIVLDNGIAVERGTHRELMEKNGFYSKLITND